MAAMETVRFYPLGGLGEIGMNCFALEQRGEILVVDCGAAFPEDDLGVDIIVPDFSWLLARQASIKGVFITHGHEDHIGALRHLLRLIEREIPVFAPAHACALIAGRLKDSEMSSDCLHAVEPRHVYQVGSFSVEPIHVAHSIIFATALSIRTDAGTILHTADFDLDDEQPAGFPTDAARFEELGQEGVVLLLSDSTNIDSPRRERSEGDVGRALSQVIEQAQHRVVVGMFSSNAHRLLSLGQAAERCGRKLCLLGRSLSRQFDVAAALGALRFPSDLLVAPHDVADLPRDQVVVVAGGSQGEAQSALRRLSQQVHPNLQLSRGDTVVFSSRIIPGNERAVHSMQGDLMRLGVQVVTSRTQPGVHTSGHASREELAQMIAWTKPQSFVPVHGTLHHLVSHQALANELGVGDSLLVENGTSIEVSRDAPLRLGAEFPAGQVRLTWGGEVMAPRVRRRRGEMARRGLVVVSVVVGSARLLLTSPRITVLGVPGVDDDEGALAVIESAVRRSVQQNQGGRMVSLELTIRRAVRSAVQEMCKGRPLVEVHLSELDV